MDAYQLLVGATGIKMREVEAVTPPGQFSVGC